MFFKTAVTVGIDIGHHSVKTAVVGPNRKQVLHLAEAEILPERTFLEDPSSEERIIQAVKDTFSSIADSSSRYKATVSASFQAEGAVYRYLELPPLKKDQLETALKSAASKLLTYPLQDASLTALTVPGQGGQAGTFLMAVPKSAVEGHRDLLRRCGLEVERLEAAPLCALRALAANEGSTPGEFIALVHAGSRVTSLVVACEGRPYYARDFALGGSAFTYAFQMGAQSTWLEAERYKRGYDVGAREVPIEPALTRWLDQVRRTLDSFSKGNPALNARVQRIFLTGGTAAWRGLAPRLEETVKLPVSVATWKLLAPPDSLRGTAFGTWATALGLALG